MATRFTLRALMFVALAAAIAPTTALACSVVDTYIRPSNFELAQIADAIVVATPRAEIPKKGEVSFGGKVSFRVDQVLKGDAPSEIIVSPLRLGRSRPSAPDAIAYSHPQGHAGPCNRMMVSKSASYLLFLNRSQDEFVTLGYPFSRVSEDYAGEDSLWTRTVRTYLRIQATEQPMAQLTTLEAMRAAILADPKSTAADKALAEDIDQHLGSISPWKPTAHLLAAYEDLKAGRSPRYKPRDPSLDGEQSGIDAGVEALLGDLDGDRKPPPPRRSAQEERILNALLQEEHPDALPLFEAFARPTAPPDELAMAIRFMAANGRYRQAYALIETRAAPLMETAEQDDVHVLGAAISEAQQDPFYGEGRARWRSDPDVAARWPILALKLSTMAKERFGQNLYFTEALETLVVDDYRANPKLTLALSGDSNDITDWATRELTRPENLKASAGDLGGTATDPLLLPLQIELRWHGLSDEPIDDLAKVFCLGPRQRRMLFEQMGRIGGSSSAHAFLRLAASPSVDAEDRRLIMEAVAPWDRRYEAWWGESWLKADPAMQKMARGETITAVDIKPLQPVRCRA